VDGNAHFQAIGHLPDTFEELALQVFNTLPKVTVIHFVTDTYKSISIKSLERNRRGSSVSYLIQGPKMKLARDFKSFLLNSDNKQQFIKFLLSEWQADKYSNIIKGRSIFFVSEEQCFYLQSTDGISVQCSPVVNLFSTQEEADTRIILHCLYASQVYVILI